MDDLLRAVTDAILLGRRVNFSVSVSVDGRVENNSEKGPSLAALREAASKEANTSPPTLATPRERELAEKTGPSKPGGGLLGNFIEQGVGLTKPDKAKDQSGPAPEAEPPESPVAPAAAKPAPRRRGLNKKAAGPSTEAIPARRKPGRPKKAEAAAQPKKKSSRGK